MLILFSRKFLRNITLDETLFFLANKAQFETENNPLNIVLDIFRCVIWQFKLNKRLPSYTLLESEIVYIISTLVLASKRFKKSLINCKYFQINLPDDGGRDLRPQHPREGGPLSPALTAGLPGLRSEGRGTNSERCLMTAGMLENQDSMEVEVEGGQPTLGSTKKTGRITGPFVK
jgi:hypothetical protein